MTIIDFENIAPPPEQHPKCKGWINEQGEGECGYNTTIGCDECKYCVGRKDPAAKCNQDNQPKGKGNAN